MRGRSLNRRIWVAVAVSKGDAAVGGDDADTVVDDDDDDAAGS